MQFRSKKQAMHVVAGCSPQRLMNIIFESNPRTKNPRAHDTVAMAQNRTRKACHSFHSPLHGLAFGISLCCPGLAPMFTHNKDKQRYERNYILL